MVSQTSTAFKTSSITLSRILLHSEGAATFIGSIVLFAQLDLSWWIYPLLLLVPDLSMIGYLAGQEAGAWAYNAVHTYTPPLTLALLAFVNGWTMGMGLALIWIGHIGLDRMMGYGLKYPTNFKDTHLNRV